MNPHGHLASHPTVRRNVLVVAYYFPPMALSGVQRIAKFVKYLPDFGWTPTVLTVEPRAYFAYDTTILEELEEAGIEIIRTSSLDPTRIFSRPGRLAMPGETARKGFSYLSQLAFVPDNKIGWKRPALRRAVDLVESRAFDLVFSTAPPYTAHLIGAALSRRTGIPLVADFRDDWVGNPRHVYPTRAHRLLNQRLESRVVRTAARVVTINRFIGQALTDRNSRDGWQPSVSIIPQGYDAADFPSTTPPSVGKLRLLYSGVFYDVQTPDFFLRAVHTLLRRQPDLSDKLELEFVGALPRTSLGVIKELGLSDIVRYEGYLSHRKTVERLTGADVLWMTVGRRKGAEGISTGKLYEYFGARKPILALAPEGAVREVLSEHGAAFIAEPDDTASILQALNRIVDLWKARDLPIPREDFVNQYERRHLTGLLAQLFDDVASTNQ